MSAARRSAALVLPAVLLLSGCGGDIGGATSAAPTSSAAAEAPNGPGGADFQKIQECLTAAGISVPTPSGGFQRPTGTPPSGGPGRQGGPGGPGGTPPSGAPRGGGFGGIFRSDEAQAALKACGITVPTGSPDGARPSASPSS
jgi:hypothetical protein